MRCHFAHNVAMKKGLILISGGGEAPTAHKLHKCGIKVVAYNPATNALTLEPDIQVEGGLVIDHLQWGVNKIGDVFMGSTSHPNMNVFTVTKDDNSDIAIWLRSTDNEGNQVYASMVFVGNTNGVGVPPAYYYAGFELSASVQAGAITVIVNGVTEIVGNGYVMPTMSESGLDANSNGIYEYSGVAPHKHTHDYGTIGTYRGRVAVGNANMPKENNIIYSDFYLQLL